MTNAALVFGSEPRDDADGRVGLEKEPEERVQTVHEACENLRILPDAIRYRLVGCEHMVLKAQDVLTGGTDVFDGGCSRDGFHESDAEVRRPGVLLL